MKTITTKCGYNLKVGKVYPKENKFFGKVMIYFEGSNKPSRFEIEYFNSIVNEEDKIKN